MEIIKQDILTGLESPSRYPNKVVILYGCNCHHTMGAGIARYLSAKFPQVLVADRTQSINHDRGKMGSYTTAVIVPHFHILNCYTQFDYKRYSETNPVDYDSIRACLRTINTEYDG